MGKAKASRDELVCAFKDVKLMTLDVDGVLTDGTLYYAEDGSEMRVFNVHDGMGMKLVMASGLPVAMISASTTASIRARGKKLGMKHVYTGVEDKVDVMKSICEEVGADLSQVIHIGDDLNDIPMLETVGFPITVPNAVDEVIDRAMYVTQKPGGTGAVREICEMLLIARKGSVI